jgi:hypothetical protein
LFESFVYWKTQNWPTNQSITENSLTLGMNKQGMLFFSTSYPKININLPQKPFQILQKSFPIYY